MTGRRDGIGSVLAFENADLRAEGGNLVFFRDSRLARREETAQPEEENRGQDE
jgi:hypothetical protein